MLKQILKLDGVSELTNNQLKVVKGGYVCSEQASCPANRYCDFRWGNEGLCIL
ncbi:hypothetical protein J8281_12385 [Aquimarina sp. U1-2]|uniref:hypothetical protein n=1 Tax=Aquimarina sp. U1-2 TaxID=2823141 RepID=UPI001AECB42A|nr:hypothetical protein [Aquimarina sp. U1-2]MBP2832986.1 hypothetical protein [Aquimarina sp. U1-2]